jgi:hypothetical protein
MSEVSEWTVARQVFPGVNGEQRCSFETVIGMVLQILSRGSGPRLRWFPERHAFEPVIISPVFKFLLDAVAHGDAPVLRVYGQVFSSAN